MLWNILPLAKFEQCVIIKPKRGRVVAMAKIEIPTLKKYQRPVIEIGGLFALIDTGATIPMFSVPGPILKKAYSAEKILENGVVGGIGGFTMGDIYRLPEFKVDELEYAPFEVFVPHKQRLNYPLLLSSTLFYGMRYTVDTVESMFIVDTKNEPTKRSFKIISLEGKLYPQIDNILVQDGDLLSGEFFLSPEY